MKISLGTWAFTFGPYATDPIPFDQAARRLSQAGYDGIEICGFPPHITLEAYPTAESRRDLVRMLQDYHLQVSGYAADFTTVNAVIPENRQRYLELFRRNLEMAVAIGSPALRVDSVAAPGSIRARDYQAAMSHLAGVWHEAAEIAAQAGVRVVWEFEPGFAFNKASEVFSMHQQVAHPNFSVMFDTAHAYMCGVVGARQHRERETLPGGVMAFLKKLEGRIGAVHLSDSDGTLYAEETSTHCAFGAGLIDFQRLAPALLAVPRIEWWCLDLCFLAGSWDLVDPSLEYVRALLRSNAVAI